MSDRTALELFELALAYEQHDDRVAVIAGATVPTAIRVLALHLLAAEQESTLVFPLGDE